MKITDIELGMLRVPLKTPFKTALRTVDTVEDVVVLVRTDSGHTGYGEAAATAVITGDITQVDLPRGTKSGLNHVIEVLRDVPGISFTHFSPKDVVRHPLVQRIVEAYERFEHKDDVPPKDVRRDA